MSDAGLRYSTRAVNSGLLVLMRSGEVERRRGRYNLTG
jgi:hypothetical protein